MFNHTAVYSLNQFIWIPRLFFGGRRGWRANLSRAAREGTGMRVLLIEDDSATAQSIELMLKV